MRVELCYPPTIVKSHGCLLHILVCFHIVRIVAFICKTLICRMFIMGKFCVVFWFVYFAVPVFM
jgi:hypothetical protein